MLRFILHNLRKNEEGMFQKIFIYYSGKNVRNVCSIEKKVKLQYTLYVALLNIKDDRK